MAFTDVCIDCDGRGKIEIVKDGKITEEFCFTCDGTGVLEEYEAFQKQPRRKKDFDDEEQ